MGSGEMGMTEHRTHELETNGLGKSRVSENLVQNAKCEPMRPDDYKLDSKLMVIDPVEQKDVAGAKNIEGKLVSTEESLSGAEKMGPNPGNVSPNVIEPVEQKDVTVAQNIENKLVSVEENLPRTEEMGPNSEDVSPNFDAGGKLSENVKTSPVLESSEVPSKNEPINLEDTELPPGFSYPDPGNVKLEPTAEVVTDNPGHVEDDTKRTPALARNGKAKFKSPVTSSWSLRSKSQEKPKVPDSIETANEVSADKEKKRRGRKKKQMRQSTVDEFSRARTHLRYLLHRIKYEQNLIDAYSAEGWKGQSLEKLKPEKELQRAKSHILRYKLKIRELFQRLDSSLALGKLPASLFDSKGEIDSEDIFCAKCGSKDLPLDNDIILCDGACERGFHQFCLEPPLLKEQIPPGDEGWLCPGCECKVDCIDMLKDYQGSKISILDSWEKIFPEAAAAASGNKLDDDHVSSSDDSEDDDYDPDKPDKKVEGDESCSNESDYFSASEKLGAPSKNESIWTMGLPPDDSEDDDFDPSAGDPGEQAKQESSSSDFTSDSEDLGALLDDASAPGEEPEHISPTSGPNHDAGARGGSKEEPINVGRMRRRSLKDELSSLLAGVDEPVSGKRHVKRLDYKKLHDETFQDSSSDSSDEEFDDKTTRKRRKINREKAELTAPNITPITEIKIDTKDENQEGSPLPKRTRRNSSGEGTKESSARAGSSAGTKRPHKRLGADVTQRLLVYFNQNQYPDKDAKEKMANELGITIQQVSKWFENTRWQFNHRPRPEPNIMEKQPEPLAIVSPTGELLESNGIPTQN